MTLGSACLTLWSITNQSQLLMWETQLINDSNNKEGDFCYEKSMLCLGGMRIKAELLTHKALTSLWLHLTQLQSRSVWPIPEWHVEGNMLMRWATRTPCLRTRPVLLRLKSCLTPAARWSVWRQSGCSAFGWEMGHSFCCCFLPPLLCFWSITTASHRENTWAEGMSPRVEIHSSHKLQFTTPAAN